jgi:hypothetical protein
MKNSGIFLLINNMDITSTIKPEGLEPVTDFLKSDENYLPKKVGLDCKIRVFGLQSCSQIGSNYEVHISTSKEIPLDLLDRLEGLLKQYKAKE